MKFLFAYVLLFLALTVGQVWLAHERGATNIDGTTYALLDDDIVISHTYAHQLVEGRGLVLNEGDRVEGFSNPAWLLLAMVPSELAGVSIQHLGWFIWTLNAMLAAGTLKTTVAARFPLTEIQAAHRMVEEARHMGNVVIDIDG